VQQKKSNFDSFRAELEMIRKKLAMAAKEKTANA